MRLAIVATHPIQYHAPWFRHLSESHELTVYYAHRQDSRGQAEAGFGVDFEWDVPLLDGYGYQWLTNVARAPSISTFAGCDTPEIAEYIRTQRFDACLVLGWNKKSYWQAFRACKRTHTPILCRGDSQLQTPRSRWQRMAKYLPYRVFLPSFDIHLCVGQRNREYLRHYGVRDSQLVLCPHFVDNEWFRSRADEARQTGAAARVRAEYGIPEDAFVLLYVGKFIAKKRVSDIVEAAIRLVRGNDVPKLHLLLVGDGRLRSELERQAQDWRSNVHFAGFRNQQEIPAYYAAGSAITLASESETWGLVVNEAMACGLPAIVSDAVGCAPDLIEEAKTGVSFPVGNVDALSDRIAQLSQLILRSADDTLGRLRRASGEPEMSAPEEARRGLALNEQTMRDSVRSKIASYSMQQATAGLNEALRRIHRGANLRSAHETDDDDQEVSSEPDRSVVRDETLIDADNH